MNLILCCFMAALLLASGAAVDVEKTVHQVQSILQANSQLPRLSRDEILQLLNDIRTEDAKTKSHSTEYSGDKNYYQTTISYNDKDNEVNPSQQNIRENIVTDDNDDAISTKVPTTVETMTTSEPNIMVVLPYTPRDGASLQELYTRPPRTKVLPESKVTPKPSTFHSNEKLQETLKTNAKLANQKRLDFPAELQAFLDEHGLKGTPGQDSFLLPLEGFKPLPAAKIVDGNIQLPENILLSYDLISPESDSQKEADDSRIHMQSSFLYEPLRPEMPFELDTSSSEKLDSTLPLDMPKRKTTTPRQPNYEPIDYDSVRVIPLNKGPNPVEDVRIISNNDVDKRQVNISVESQASVTTTETPSTAVVGEERDAITNSPASDNDQPSASDSGASITDLEDSFGGAAPEQPGDSEIPPPRKNGFYWMLDWNSFLEVGEDEKKVNIRFEPKLGDPQMFIPVNVP